MSFFFIQMADPQFGMFKHFGDLTDEEIEERRRRGVNVVSTSEKATDLANETRLYTRAIQEANRLKPAFVAMCGDMTNDRDDESQLEELMRITGQLDESIPMYWVAGNHDIGDAPTSESLMLYRERFGKDNYSFDHGGSHFVVINSPVCYDPSNVPHEWNRLMEFLKDDLQQARAGGCDDIVVFTHHPLFLEHPDEGDGYFVIPEVRRRPILELLRAHNVAAVFAGHLHKNAYATDGNLQMITTGALGYPLGDDPSGVRVVKMLGDSIQHQYYAVDDLPDAVEI